MGASVVVGGAGEWRSPSGYLTIDRERYTVMLADLRLPLTRLEFDLLDFLVQNSGKVMTYQELVVRVLGCTFDPESTALRVHVAHLRRKLRDAAVAIVTVRGRGLLFAPETVPLRRGAAQPASSG